MFATMTDELAGRGAGVLLGLLLGALSTWLLARWKRLRAKRSVLKGDARDTIVIAQHLVERRPAPAAGASAEQRTQYILRIRSLGQGELERVVPNGHLAAELLRRAFEVTPRAPLISMEGAEGSYLLETLTNFVCDRTANSHFEHDLYVMAPCCEPAGLAEHQPITILLAAVADLPLFENWPACREMLVEHGSDGSRILTLMDVARRFKEEQGLLARLRQAGQRTHYVETMYILDLALDRRAADVSTQKVPWGRFEPTLKEMNLE